MSQIILVTGPTRSGKSEWAETLAQQTEKQVVYIATAQNYPEDADWQIRLQKHRQRRPADWQLKEVPIALLDVLETAQPTECLLIDSLGTWITNCIELPEAEWEIVQQALIQSLENTKAEVILVAEETGWGLVPTNPVGRIFRDRLGSLTRAVGAIAAATYLVVAGFAVDLRQVGVRVGEEKGG
ncbi:MAG: bifunctional adenosylcobinamide kinase/adenosylcobinamide-phosphate guanylyltransferase [Leptolyngbyaceae cyanobacterium SM1_1_3]|nr:bifunctional adenosylcobinamide kinase/adenosylcobinamide-phosphate guanylyltransferase [Leptolyngbyaceae cyanobacterium SM1_1_3]NJN03694.1 bifunctional adenosylcobinamide kinase/adenosylcobinamide-phosphate guanylyltransferase [Leptolyngbyaceae cyanobacterium RM1_1_2]